MQPLALSWRAEDGTPATRETENPMSIESSLTPLFAPRSVAVVGASRRAGTVGSAVLANLLKGGFQGPVYPINPHASFVQSVRAYPELGSLPEVPTLVIIALPAAQTLPVIREAAKLGVKAICVLSAGFAEVDEAGRAMEREMTEIVRKAGIRLLGPNCLGLQNPDPAVRLDATFATTFAPDGHIAFSSQSGALGLAALDYAQDLGIGISTFASLGNKADISSNDVLEYIETDPRCRVVLLYLESLGNAQRFREIAARVGRRKPIALMKSGRSKSGARAAGSHTGAITGPDSSVSALCKQTGIIRASTLEELFDVAMVLANQPLPGGRRVGVVTNAGGPGILAADALEAAGLEMPSLSKETEVRLREILPAAASVKNPVDILASTAPEAYGLALAAVLADPLIDIALTIYVPPITTSAAEVAAAIVKSAAHSPKPVLSCFMGTHGVPESLRSLHEGHVPSFRFPEDAAQTLALAVAHAEWRRSPPSAPLAQPETPPEAAAALKTARRRLGAPGGWLSSSESSALCRAWSIDLPRERLVAASVGAAEAAALEVGFPVVLKAERSDLVHKTEAGAVALGIESAAGVREAAGRLLALEPERILVQQQLTGGDEWLVGAIRDPDFGPLVTVGAGGTWTELWKDIEQRLGPLTQIDLEALLDRPRIGQSLAGWRGAKPRDRAALQCFVRQLAFAAMAHAEIEEIEANPVLVMQEGGGATAVDVRIRLTARA
jgi:acetyl coenzyme A synthetase (ADP forming)-like protein